MERKQRFSLLAAAQAGPALTTTRTPAVIARPRASAIVGVDNSNKWWRRHNNDHADTPTRDTPESYGMMDMDKVETEMDIGQRPNVGCLLCISVINKNPSIFIAILYNCNVT